jgi:hypothetical protein
MGETSGGVGIGGQYVVSSRADGGGGRGGVGSQGWVGNSRGPWGLRWLSIKGDGRGGVVGNQRCRAGRRRGRQWSRAGG